MSVLLILLVLSGFYGQDAPAKVQQSSIMWREGDPSRVECNDDSKPKRDWLLPGPECAKQVFAKFGQPFMFPARKGIAYGISVPPDKPGTIFLWADNQTPAPQGFLICCISTVLDHVDVYDEEGHRVLSESDKLKQKAEAEGTPTTEVCSCSGWVTIPPHVIACFAFSSADLSQQYKLPSGKYIVSERTPAGTANFSTAPSAKPPAGLPILIP